MMATAAVIVYALLWLAYALHWGWLQEVDDAVLQPLYDYGVKHPGWVQFWDVLCTVFSPAAFRLVGAAIVVLAVFRRNLRVILFILTAIGMSGIVTQIAKGLADRPRPITALAAASSSAFPSGHALGVMAAVLALLTISAGMFNRRGRAASIVFGAVVVIAVGVGRIVLNVHHPSDVLAGWALGYLWFLACLLAIRPLPLAAVAAPEVEPIGAAADETPQARGI
ncbi:phosphatase PAP2 family protein [Mycobacterium sp.]|uniref:phosphatase PAP2 family protein n=1 Tax=Mycobacterium sp. TaxID=1785 RepID=UPI003C76F9F6